VCVCCDPQAHAFTSSAAAAIEEAGGKCILLSPTTNEVRLPYLHWTHAHPSEDMEDPASPAPCVRRLTPLSAHVATCGAVLGQVLPIEGVDVEATTAALKADEAKSAEEAAQGEYFDNPRPRGARDRVRKQLAEADREAYQRLVGA
jgi:hypothetical protein